MKKLILLLVALSQIGIAQVETKPKKKTAAEKYGNYGPVLDMIAQGITNTNRALKLKESIKNTPKQLVPNKK